MGGFLLEGEVLYCLGIWDFYEMVGFCFVFRVGWFCWG